MSLQIGLEGMNWVQYSALGLLSYCLLMILRGHRKSKKEPSDEIYTDSSFGVKRIRLNEKTFRILRSMSRSQKNKK